MNRCHDRAPALAVGRALQLLPDGILDLVGCEFVIGVDPVFADIHRYAETSFGSSYGEVAHCVYGYHQLHRPVADRGTKVVLPSAPAFQWDSSLGAMAVTHELGHVLHERVGLDWVAAPTTEYGRSNQHEAFAEAFTDWIWGGRHRARVDERTAALLRGLARS